MIKLIHKQTGKEIIPFTNIEIFTYACTQSLTNAFCVQSETLRKAIEKYKDRTLVKHELTVSEQRAIESNSDSVENIPKYEVRGYDDYVTSVAFDKRLNDEFIQRFKSDDRVIVRLINQYNSKYKAVII